jgi:hypothetical protein
MFDLFHKGEGIRLIPELRLRLIGCERQLGPEEGAPEENPRKGDEKQGSDNEKGCHHASSSGSFSGFSSGFSYCLCHNFLCLTFLMTYYNISFKYAGIKSSQMKKK